MNPVSALRAYTPPGKDHFGTLCCLLTEGKKPFPSVENNESCGGRRSHSAHKLPSPLPFLFSYFPVPIPSARLSSAVLPNPGFPCPLILPHSGHRMLKGVLFSRHQVYFPPTCVCPQPSGHFSQAGNILLARPSTPS